LNGLYCLDLYREPRSKTVKTQQLEGERVCITGTIPGITREALADNVRDNGAVFTPSVSKKTTILFYGHDAGGKLTKARELNVTTVDLTDPLQRETWGYLLED
jgi:DNA ligase (NAD+)